jgi:ATP phosphoribosyltransferase
VLEPPSVHTVVPGTAALRLNVQPPFAAPGLSTVRRFALSPSVPVDVCCEVETVVESEAVLIGTDSISPEKRGILDELLFRFDSVQAADDKKYILMNVPQKKLNDVLSVLPGIKSPTVMPLADKEWCSVHTVLDEKCFWEIINRLKTAGAEGILVLDIEKMIL